jgi:hypothetical protein
MGDLLIFPAIFNISIYFAPLFFTPIIIVGWIIKDFYPNFKQKNNKFFNMLSGIIPLSMILIFGAYIEPSNTTVLIILSIILTISIFTFKRSPNSSKGINYAN